MWHLVEKGAIEVQTRVPTAVRAGEAAGRQARETFVTAMRRLIMQLDAAERAGMGLSKDWTAVVIAHVDGFTRHVPTS